MSIALRSALCFWLPLLAAPVAPACAAEIAGGATDSGPRIIYVNQSAVGTNDGSSWADAYTDLQDALAEVVAGDEIWVAEGTYRPDRGTGDRYARYDLRSGISLYGSFAGWESCPDERVIADHPTILDGDLLGNDDPAAVPTSDCCFGIHAAGCDNEACEQLVVSQPGMAICGNGSWQLNCVDAAGNLCGGLCRPTRSDNSVAIMSLTGSQEAVIDGFAFVRADGYCPTSDPRCLDQGQGALYANSAGGIIRNCTFKENAATSDVGSALDSWYTTGILVERCRFEDNGVGLTRDPTAAFQISGHGDSTVVACEFLRNGGIDVLLLDSGGRIERCVFRDNDGGVRTLHEPAYVRSCLFVNNTTKVLDVEAPTQIASSLFFGNGASETINAYSSGTGIVNCVVAGNAGTGILVGLSPHFSARRERRASSAGASPARQGVAPAGSNRSGGGGNEAVEASGVRVAVRRLGEQAGRNVSER